MLFNSLHFCLFFFFVTIFYFLIPHRWRWALLLLASAYFYSVFKPIYILILLVTIVVDYNAGLLIQKSNGKTRKLWLIVSIIVNIGFLCFFKYFNFLNGILTEMLGWANQPNPVPYLEILLPVGLSFHTFQALSYTIEVYRGNFKAERHFGLFALYVMFYPQLVAGPIERPQNMLPQFHQKHDFNAQEAILGLRKMAWGMFKKVVIADRLAQYVNQVYGHPADYEGIPLVLATVFFAFQIYCDFSGYSDIAIGSARVMGFRLMQNFDRPYFSLSLAEFWRRWHISLSTWFRDYVYIPLGGNQVDKSHWYFNLFITFLLSGVWHGASWNFILWGAFHGSFLVLALIFQPVWKKMEIWFSKGLGENIWKSMNWLTTFGFVCFAWVFFRTATLPDAWYIIRHSFHQIREGVLGIIFNQNNLRGHFLYVELPKSYLIMSLLNLIILFAVERLQGKGSFQSRLDQFPFWLRWMLYLLFSWYFLFCGFFESSLQFTYFQF